MKGLTLTQPWATLIAVGAKLIETRSWPTSYRGPLAIHAATSFPPAAQRACMVQPFESALFPFGYTGDEPEHAFPRGAIIAVTHLRDVLHFDVRSEAWARRASAEKRLPDHEADFGDFSPGRFGFVLDRPRRLEKPIACRGMLGVWDVPVEIAMRLEQLT